MFDNRVQAGKKLADRLQKFKGKDVVVLGVPRGGVVVANEVAKALGAPLDVVIAKKIGAPGEPEYALGAVTEEGDVVVNWQETEFVGASRTYVESQVRERKLEIRERSERLRGGIPYPELEGKVVLIVDDGIATGSTMEAAVKSVRRRQPTEVIVAVPVAPGDAVQRLSQAGVEVVCLESPRAFFAIGEFYREFGQVEDQEVERILREGLARRRAN